MEYAVAVPGLLHVLCREGNGQWPSWTVFEELDQEGGVRVARPRGEIDGSVGERGRRGAREGLTLGYMLYGKTS